ncbi:MAG: XRE family transcriptional regulator [Alphaproteobacteria bacterium]|nr:XRE family transcriptional regulator [Alphaproteobacteria bacterium]
MRDSKKSFQHADLVETVTRAVMPEGMAASPEGQNVPVPTRNRRGRKGSRKGSHPLRDLRLSREMTLEELAEISGLSPSYLSRLESGSRRLNVDTINKLSDALRCDPSDLLSSTDSWINKGGVSGYNLHSAQTMVQGRGGHYRPNLSNNPSSSAVLSNQKIPLYETDIKTGIVDFTSPMCHIPAPSEIAGVPGAFAFTVYDHTMEPRFYRGDRLLVHPGKPLSPRATAMVITTDNRVIIGEFVAWRQLSDLDEKFHAANDTGETKQEEYMLELKQYKNADPNNFSRREGDAPLGQVLLNHNEISSIARVIGMVEA